MTTSLKTPDVKTPDPLLDTIRAGAHEASAAGWIALGALWIGYGMFVLSFQTGSLAAVASLIGVAFLFGGTTQLVVAAREPTMRWLNIIGGIAGPAAALLTFAWPGITLYVVSIMVACYLIAYGTIHIVTAPGRPCRPGGGPGCCSASPSWSSGWAASLLGVLAARPGHPGRGMGHQPRGQRDLRRLHAAPGRQERRATGRLTTRLGAQRPPPPPPPPRATRHRRRPFARFSAGSRRARSKEQRSAPPTCNAATRRCCSICKSAPSTARTGSPARSPGSPAR